jgi:hypothetical protein
VAHAQAVDTFNSMGSKQKKKLCKHYIGSLTAEMSMQLSSTQPYEGNNNFADRDLYFNTLRHNDPGISSQIDVPELQPLVDDVPELQPLVDDGIQFPQTVVPHMFTEMEEDSG